MSVNKVILVGNVGKDPEVRYLENNTPVCNFSLATNETYTNRAGEKVTTTEWHNIVLWRGLAEVAQKFVKKGTQIFIEGKIRTRSYDDRDGNKRYITEIVGDSMQLLGRRQDEGPAGPVGTAAPNSHAPSENSKPASDFDAPSAQSEPGNDLPF